MDYELQSDLEVPPMRRNKKSKYPFPSMEVDQSFFIEIKGETEEERDKERRRAYGAVSWANRRYEGKKFICRYVPEKGGMGIWREA